jgi:hypothetical protein
LGLGGIGACGNVDDETEHFFVPFDHGVGVVGGDGDVIKSSSDYHERSSSKLTGEFVSEHSTTVPQYARDCHRQELPTVHFWKVFCGGLFSRTGARVAVSLKPENALNFFDGPKRVGRSDVLPLPPPACSS